MHPAKNVDFKIFRNKHYFNPQENSYIQHQTTHNTQIPQLNSYNQHQFAHNTRFPQQNYNPRKQ